MNAKNLNNATKIFDRIKEIDKDIIEMEKEALLLAENRSKCKIVFMFEHEKDKKKAKFDEDGSLVNSENKMGGIFGFMRQQYIEEKKIDNNFDFNLTEQQCYKIFQFFYNEKIKERENLIESLFQMGIKL